MELIIKTNPNDKNFPTILVDRGSFTEVIVNGATVPRLPSYGFPVEQPYLRLIYDWLISKKYIEAICWSYFRYFFDGRNDCPDDIEPIIWLKKSKEGIGILVYDILQPYLSKDTKRRLRQKERIMAVTEKIFLDKDNKSCHVYKRSGGISRTDAGELENFLASIQDFRNS